MITYKINVLATLKEKGFNTSRLRKEKLLAESTLQTIREGQLVSYRNLDRLCALMEYQPGDILEYVPEEPEGTE